MSGKYIWEFVKKHHPTITSAIAALFITVAIIHLSNDNRHIDTTINTPVDTMMYHILIKDLNSKIVTLDDSISILNKRKAEIKIKYETQYLDYLNPIVVTDDSITRYIANRISEKRHNLYLLQQGRK